MVFTPATGMRCAAHSVDRRPLRQTMLRMVLTAAMCLPKHRVGCESKYKKRKGKAAWTNVHTAFPFGSSCKLASLCCAQCRQTTSAPNHASHGSHSRDPSPETQYRECKSEKDNEKGRAAWTASTLLFLFGCLCQARTDDPAVNSRMLYQLS